MRERPVSTRRAPLDDPQLINEAYSGGTLSTASKRNKVMAGLCVLRPSGGEKCRLVGRGETHVQRDGPACSIARGMT